MKSYVVLILISIFFTSTHAEMIDKNEPRFFLVFKLLKTSGPISGAKIDLYQKPSLESKLITLRKDEEFNRVELMTRFYNKKEPFKFLVVASTEKKGKFYKVFYDGKYLWVNDEDLVHAHNVYDYFRHIGPFGIEGDSYKWVFDKVGGKNIKKEKFFPIESLYTQEEIENTRALDDPLGSVEDILVKNKHVWIKINYCDTFTYHGLDCRGDFTFWFRPYDDNGKITNWAYAHKETSLEH